MNLFALLAALMCAAACLLVLKPLLWRARPPAMSGVEREFAEQYALLQGRRAAGEEGARVDVDEAALARRALDALVRSAEGARPPGTQASRMRAIFGVVLFVPLVSLPVYWKVGAPQALDPALATSGEAAQERAAVDAMRARITELEARLAARPDDAQGWALLGRSHAALDDFAKAVAAFRRADALAPKDAQMLADYADALAMAQGRKLAGEPERLLDRALSADPANIKSLLLAGTAAFERADYKAAVTLWERAVSLVPQEGELVAQVRRSIEEARAKAAAPADSARSDATKADATKADAATAGAEAIRGRVTLAKALSGTVQPEDTVFIFARAAQGPRMPLAAMKLKVRELPADFRLDDAMAMTPQARISQAGDVIVTARVSRSGDPIPKAGDLEGQSVPVKPGTGGITVEIDRQVK